MMKRDTHTPRRALQEQRIRHANRAARSLMADPDTVWSAALTLSGAEYRAQRALRHWRACGYLPLCRRWRRVNRYARGKTLIAYPAIAGCLFVGFHRGRERWFDVFRSIPSLYGVLGVRGRPVAIDGARLLRFIHDNRFRFDAAEEERFMRTHHEFTIGDRVHIVEGPFAGRVVDVRQIKGRYAHILLDLLGGPQNVEILLDKLEKVD